MDIISKIILPIIIIIIIIYAFSKKIDIYNTFLDGAKEGLITVFNIFPSIMAMIFAINIFLDSNILNTLASVIKFNIPSPIIPMALLRPISGTASLAIMNDIYILYGPDSYLGRLSSIIEGCTDTTIYVIALYFGSIKIKNIRYALIVGLFADLVGIIAAFILTNLFF